MPITAKGNPILTKWRKTPFLFPFVCMELSLHSLGGSPNQWNNSGGEQGMGRKNIIHQLSVFFQKIGTVKYKLVILLFIH